MFEIKVYSADYKSEWDSFIKNSKNGTFLFFRNYMDYHADRFDDLSFLFFKKGKLEAVLPGNSKDKTYYSHQGLTYGGLILSSKLSTIDVLAIFELLNRTLKVKGIERIIYKQIPLIYHRIPAQEDIYALFRNNAIKIGCNISSTIYQNNKLKFIESRKSGVRKGTNAGVAIRESNNYDLFWPILNQNLENKHGKTAVHSLKEMNYLAQSFPENIKLYIASLQDEIIAGTVLYITDIVVHVQYISANERGKEVGALDCLFNHLINDNLFSASIFDFGQSTENMGNYLNENLIFQKEGFGGRGIVYDVYEYQIY
jgi:hypothetical protein